MLYFKNCKKLRIYYDNIVLVCQKSTLELCFPQKSQKICCKLNYCSSYYYFYVSCHFVGVFILFCFSEFDVEYLLGTSKKISFRILIKFFPRVTFKCFTQNAVFYLTFEFWTTNIINVKKLTFQQQCSRQVFCHLNHKAQEKLRKTTSH